ncbi:hypothetical protein NT04LS_0878, partial [Listeria seeligeri FSL S4-171]
MVIPPKYVYKKDLDAIISFKKSFSLTFFSIAKNGI